MHIRRLLSSSLPFLVGGVLGIVLLRTTQSYWRDYTYKRDAVEHCWNVETQSTMTAREMPPGLTCYGRMLSGVVVKYQDQYLLNLDVPVVWYNEFPYEIGIRRCNDGSYSIVDEQEYEKWFSGQIQLLREEFETDEHIELVENWPKLSLKCNGGLE